MANPPITLRRGEGWTNSGWRANRPILERAKLKTIQGLGYLGLTYSKSKICTVDRYQPGSRPDDTVGRALDVIQSKLYVETNDDGKLRAVRNSHMWSSIALHEVVHCIRSEYFDYDDNFVELAASEGLAHNAEELYVQKFGGKQVMSDFFEGELTMVDSHLFEEFTSLVCSPKSRFDRYAHWQWFEGRTKHTALRDGSLLGAQLVHQQLQNGHTIQDLITLPAEDVLGLS